MWCHICGNEATIEYRLIRCDECGELFCPDCSSDNGLCSACDPGANGQPWRIHAVHNPIQVESVSVYVDPLTGDLEVIEW